MIIKLLTEHHLEFLSLKGGCRGSSESTCQNLKLLEISCCGSIIILHNNLYLVLVDPRHHSATFRVYLLFKYQLRTFALTR